MATDVPVFHGDYGTVVIHPDMVAVSAQNDKLYEWAHRPNNQWPCSALADFDNVCAWFDKNGLQDFQGYNPGNEEDHFSTEDVTSDELTAWANDVLRECLPESHPAYAVTVGYDAQS